MNLRVSAVLIFILFQSVSAYAVRGTVLKETVEKATVGGENEWSTRIMYRIPFGKTDDDQARPENRGYRDEWARIMKERCARRTGVNRCKVESIVEDYWEDDKIVKGKVRAYRVTYDDGWWYEFDVDVGVVETRHAKSTLGQLEKMEDRMQRDMWDVAAKVGLEVIPENQTQIHLGVESTWDNDVRKVRNYLVDCVNHQEVPILFTDNPTNAPPVSLIGRNQFGRFAEVIAEVDSGKIKTVEELKRQLVLRVFDHTYDEAHMTENDRREKFQAENVSRMGKETPLDQRTIEERSQPQGKNAKQYIELVRYRVYRAAFINSFEGRIKLHKFNSDASPTAMASNFYGAVREIGLSWTTYKKFIRKKFRRVKPKDYIPTYEEGDDISITCFRAKVREIFKQWYEKK